MNVPPASVERVQKCLVNFEIYRFLKKTANLPHPPLPYFQRSIIAFPEKSLTRHACAAGRRLISCDRRNCLIYQRPCMVSLTVRSGGVRRTWPHCRASSHWRLAGGHPRPITRLRKTTVGLHTNRKSPLLMISETTLRDKASRWRGWIWGILSNGGVIRICVWLNQKT